MEEMELWRRWWQWTVVGSARSGSSFQIWFVVRRGPSSFGEEFLRSTRSEEWPVSAKSRSRNGGVAGVVRGVVEDRTYCTRF
nr:hypothetical protein Itr_chr01CG08140 [Ipomoea trifida]